MPRRTCSRLIVFCTIQSLLVLRSSCSETILGSSFSELSARSFEASMKLKVHVVVCQNESSSKRASMPTCSPRSIIVVCAALALGNSSRSTSISSPSTCASMR